jgi:hypothetical protein
MRILTLLVRHGTDKFPNALEDCAALFSRQLPRVHWDLVVIDNKLQAGYENRLGTNRMLIGGSNLHREFSAWQDGLNYVGVSLGNYDFINLATEAFRTLYMAYLDRFDEPMLRAVLRRAAAVAHVDYYNSPVMLFGRRSQAWLRTSFLFVPPTELKLLGPLVSLAQDDALFSDDPQSPFADDEAISSNYREYLLSWLTGEGTGQGVQWHSRFELSGDTFPLFRNKVIAILNEHLFSVRLRAQGCAMVDATWLATRTHRGHANAPLGAIPSWRYQLIQRGTDAVPENALQRATA